MKIVSGPASKSLGLSIATILGVHEVPMEYKHFPDGEFYIRFVEDISGEDIVIVQTTGPPQDSNFLHLLLLVDAAKDLGAKSVIAVVPYVAYGRQEERYRIGEAVSANTIFKLIRDVGIDLFVTADFHDPKLLESLGKRFENLSAIPSLAQYMLRYNLNGAFSLAPDDGALEFVKTTSKILKGGWGWLEKKRDRVTGEVSFELKALGVKGKDVIIFDDIISTGSTMIQALRALKEQGARRIYVSCVHPLLIGDAKENILREGASEIIGTDSFQSSVSTVSIAPLIAEALKKWRR
ncbi:MAG: ribose-phosphate diphosphokinase [Candidatus Bathyarchaeota archaeon]